MKAGTSLEDDNHFASGDTTMTQSESNNDPVVAELPKAETAALDNAATDGIRVLGVIGGSSLFHAEEFSKSLTEQVVETPHGDVICHIGRWNGTSMQVVFIQRHHASPDHTYNQPRDINYRAIAAALKQWECEAVIGIYSVGSATPKVLVGRFVGTICT